MTLGGMEHIFTAAGRTGSVCPFWKRRCVEKKGARACLKNHFRNLQAPLCGIFYPHSVAVARYAALIRIKSPTNWDSQLTKSLFQTRSIPAMPDLAQVEKRLGDKKWN